MNLLLDEVDVLEVVGDPSVVDIRGVQHDSRAVGEGDLFCCLRGAETDGHEHAAEAVRRGAVGLLCEQLVPLTDRGVVQARVPAGDARHAMAQAAAAFYGHPARDLLTVGVTGTNGKTTVTSLLGDVLRHSGRKTLVVGTLSGARTTPESTEIQRQLYEARAAGGGNGLRPAAVLEVSSHALVQARVDAMRFDLAVFTNLSHEHLDFHGDMESYFAAKMLLFTPERAVTAVINVDDEWGSRLAGQSSIPVVPVHVSQATEVDMTPGRSSFVWRGERVAVPLTGMVNVENALLAAEAAVAIGLAPRVVAAGLSAAGPVPGRLQVITGPTEPGSGVGVTVLVDYAHTPRGLEVALGEARALVAGRVLVVFGCGGDRDRAKRPVMGRIATTLAEVTVLTSDNPRGEDPDAIAAEVLAGVRPTAEDAIASGRLVVELDRAAAIERAVRAARPGDVVLVAGKGHEQYQEMGGMRIPFDDCAVARAALTVTGTEEG